MKEGRNEGNRDDRQETGKRRGGKRFEKRRIWNKESRENKKYGIKR